MKKIQKKAFTLVELIVVITILAILWTIAFISFQWYVSSARDGVRISDMKSIEKWLELFQIKSWIYPVPDNSVTITASWTIILYQWFAWENVSRIINTNEIILDPVDNIPYIYVTNEQKTKYQLLWYMEKNNLSLYDNPLIEATYAAMDYSKRYVKVLWVPLGILLNSESLDPVSNNVDIVLTNTGYVWYLTDSEIIIWTWKVLASINPNFNCKRILEVQWYKDWDYTANPYWLNLDVYCTIQYPNNTFYDIIEDWDMENMTSNNWPLNSTWLTKVSDDTNSGSYALKQIGYNYVMMSNNFTYVKPWKKYTIEWYFKSKWTIPSKLHFWFAEYDKDFHIILPFNVRNVIWTETVLTKAISVWDTTVEFEDKWTTCSNWENSIYFDWAASIAFNIDDSWQFNDLPNYDLSPTQSWSEWFTSIIDNWTYCSLTLKAPITKTYPIGTKIRMHTSGWTYNYIAAAGQNVPNAWTKYSWEVLWISISWIDTSYFRRWTKFIKIMLIPNYLQSNESILYMDDLKMVGQ